MTDDDTDPPIDTIGRGRLEALSDSVFAIVVTLLVLELKVPHVDTATGAGLPAALTALAPKFASWVVSFATVCVIWLNHHRLLALTHHIDCGLFWLNANLLLWTSFVPFPTALLGDQLANPLAVSFYGLAMALVATAFVMMRWYLYRHVGLVREGVDRQALRAATRASLLFGPMAYGLAAVLASVHAWSAVVCYAAIPVYFAIAGDTTRRAPGRHSR
jgi:uncharacterized membrane protein